MSTIIRRRRGSRLHLSVYKRYELLTGHVPAVVSGYSGYATGTSRNLVDYIGHQMRADWQSNRTALLAIWAGELDEEEAFHDTLPWLCLGDRSRAPWAERVLDAPSPTEEKQRRAAG